MRHDVYCATACWLVVSFSLFFFFNGPVVSICLCYICRCFSFLHSALRKLLFCLLHLLYVWGLLCCTYDITALFSVLSQYSSCHLYVLRCCVRVILMPSPVLSLHYLLGYLGVVVPVLSCATIKVVTFLSDSVLKCSQGCLGGSF